jgi:hypothetical protein
LAALGEPGCPVCHIGSQSAKRFIASLLWESVTDVDTRRRLRAAHGFCRRHAIMAARVAADKAQATGMAIIYGDLLSNLATEARSSVEARRKDRDILPDAGCPACEVSAMFVEGAVGLLADAEEGSGLAAAARQEGRFLCLPHLRFGLRLADDRRQVECLVELFAPVADDIGEHLSEFVRKHGYEARDETISLEERAAWIDAIRLLVGEI